MGMLDDFSNWAGRARDRTLDSNRRLIDPKERDKISKGDRTPYRDGTPYDKPPQPIDNDFHPSDKGLEADQEDHWGTVKK